MPTTKKHIPRVFNFSGGRSSAYMTIRYYQPGDIVIFCDTGREHPKTYKFINDFEAYEKIPVIRLQYPGGFEGFLSKKTSLPNFYRRTCTVEMKINTAKRYLKYNGIKTFENFIGFRYDEPNRVKGRKEIYKKVFTVTPLHTDGITKHFINNYWLSKPYILEIPAILGNCVLCFMKGKNAIIAILTVYPEYADQWIADEDKFGKTYIKGISFRQMKSIAQNNLFKNYPLEDLQPAYSCACTT